MQGDENNQDLKCITFDKHIWNCVIEFIKQDRNHIPVDEGLIIKEGAFYFIRDVRNRNKQQVPHRIWAHLLLKHVRQINYN